MRIVLDTNVFISGIFFTGPPKENPRDVVKLFKKWA